MEMRYRYKAAHDALLNARRVLVVSHPKPDGDTLGAAAGMLTYCRKAGMNVSGFCHDEVPHQYRYLPNTEHFTNDAEAFRADGGPDVVAVFDAGDLRFAKIDAHLAAMPRKPVVINFDHHATNEQFGDINVVDVAASSTTEVVYEFLRSVGHRPCEDIAKCLLTGLVTDTGGFSNAATTVNSLTVGSELIRRGASIKEVSAQLLRNKTVPALRIWGLVLDRLKYHEGLGVASTAVFLKDIGTPGVEEEHVEGVSNFLNQFLDVDVVLVLKEVEGGKVKGSLRTAGGKDLAEVARRLGGGGHKKASGFTISGRIEERPDRWMVA